ncbi:fungal-specific transcription factor domain-containing protein [Cyathus striatus]|nr:fungal-specific transcription factor domain-containing protein [Cyathus striatus]
MSSNDDEQFNLNSQKKRKLMQRACDSCRKKKIRCDEPVHPQKKCSYCAEHNIECTFKVEPKKRGLPRGYVEGLEQRIRLLEGLVKKLCPDKDMLRSLVHHLDPEYAEHLTNSESTSSSFSPSANSPLTTSSEEMAPKNSVLDIIHKVVSIGLGSRDDPFREDDAAESEILSERLKLLSVKSEDDSCRFWGKSSGMMLMQTAVQFKNRYSKGDTVKRTMLQNKRPNYWKRLPWDKDPLRPPANYAFPSPNLIVKLSEAYFKHVNLFYPLLHRPTFDRAVANNLHLRDDGFGSVLLLVCAVGSRYTDKIDERTLVDGEDSLFSAGWKWYKQVQVVKQGVVDPPTLYGLQCYCLAIHFLTGCCTPQSMWLLSGYGLRLAQDIGLHRRRVPRDRITVEDELWKRVFWVLIFIDRMISVTIGRPCAIFDEYFDLDMPIECDDEYWEHPDPRHRFKQPEGVPSTVTAFNQHLRLTKIMTFALTTVYSIKTKCFELIFTSEWEQHIVAELDSALNNWMGALPEHLRWDPNMTDDRFFTLSGSLMTVYYYVQILIHRPFIRIDEQPSPLAFPSLTICTNAARACSLVLEHQMKRNAVVYPYMQMTAVTAAIVLLVNIWGGRRSGVAPEPRAMRQVEKCKDVLRKAEDRWHSAGSLLDILNEFTCAGELILPEDDPRLLFNVGNTEGLSEHNDLRKESNSPSATSQTSSSSSSIPPCDILPPMRDNQLYLFQQSVGSFGAQTKHLGSEQQNTIFDASFYDNSNVSIFDYGNPGLPSNQMTGEYSSSHGGDVASYPFEHLDSNINIPPPIGQQQSAVDSNTMAMWFNVPNSFQINEWNSFLASFTESTDELNNGTHPSATEGLQESFSMY